MTADARREGDGAEIDILADHSTEEGLRQAGWLADRIVDRIQFDIAVMSAAGRLLVAGLDDARDLILRVADDDSGEGRDLSGFRGPRERR